MSGEIHDECGVAAVSMKPNGQTDNRVLFTLYKLLLNQQNRGQLSAGITTFLKDRKQILDTFRNIGTVNEVFQTSKEEKSRSIFKRYKGTRGIGHVRYATFGRNERVFAQPFERHHGRLWKWFSFCFNGNLVNYSELREDLEKKKEYHFILDNDTEIIMHYISRQLAGNTKPSMQTLMKNVSSQFEGAYNLALLNAKGELMAARDPVGFRPLSYAIEDDKVIVASESNALVNSGYTKFKSLEPGKMIHVIEDDISIKRFAPPQKKAHCMFEWVYFANVSSILDERSVYVTRTKLGQLLAKLETEKITDDHIVIPVPDSAKAAGDAFAYELGVRSEEGLIRNRYVGRTFIEGSSREDKIANKYTLIKEVIKGKKILLVDDSIVRGATTKALVKALKDARAKEVHVRVSCPPIMGPCFYGIDMSTVTELLAPQYVKDPADVLPQEALDKIAKAIGADSIIYQSISGLLKAINLPKENMCLACLDRNHPTTTGKALMKIALDNFRTGKKEDKRVYETAVKCGC